MSEFTIIIPTYNNRHQYLNRVLDYFSSYDLKIIVADSSENKFSEYDQYNIDYIHLPNMNYTQKVHLALKKVKTPYTLFCADDDFIIPSAIQTCVEFLNKNTSYASVQGNIIAFKNRPRKSISTFPWMVQTYNLTFDSELAADRLNDFFKHHIYLHYSVHKTTNLVSTFSLCTDFEDSFAGSTVEYMLNIISIINGKHKVISIFYCASELAEVSGRNLYSTINQIKSTPKFHDFVEVLAEYLSNNTAVNKKESISFINNIFNESWYFSKRFTYKDKGSYPLKKMGVIKKMVDKMSFLDPLKIMYSKWYYHVGKVKKEREYKKQIKKTKELKGYPYFEKEANNEWGKIKKIIKKHGKISI